MLPSNSSANAMSQHIYKHEGIEVCLGYDQPLDYVFCTVEKDGQILYSKLSDPEAGTSQKNVEYFRPILRERGINLPEVMFDAVKEDYADRVGNRVVMYT